MQNQPWQQGWTGQGYGGIQQQVPLHAPPPYSSYPANIKEALPSFTLPSFIAP